MPKKMRLLSFIESRDQFLFIIAYGSRGGGGGGGGKASSTRGFFWELNLVVIHFSVVSQNLEKWHI